MDAGTGEELTRPPGPRRGNLDLNSSLFVWIYTIVDVVEQVARIFNKEPLLLHVEKEMEDEVNSITTIKLILRRTLVLSVILFSKCSMLNSQRSMFNLKHCSA